MRVNTLFLKSRRFKKAFHYIDHSGSFHFFAGRNFNKCFVCSGSAISLALNAKKNKNTDYADKHGSITV
jgi:hypothetical protein